MSSKKIDFNPNIHGLRGLASFFVLIYHIYRGAITADNVSINSYNFWPQDFIHYCAAFALQTLNCGIEIFFMISGYLITATLINLHNTKQFAINRCLRIYPAFLATQVVMFTIGPIIGWGWMVNLSIADYLFYIMVNILFLPGVFNLNIALPAAWTLSFEALFYLISGAIYSLSSVLHRVILTLIVIIISILTFFYLPTASFFIPGVTAFFLVTKWPNEIKRLNISFLPFWSFISMAWGLSIPLVHTNKYFFLMINCVGLLSFIYIVNGYGTIAYLLRTRVFQFLGTISYSLYLWQVPIMFPIKRILLHFFSPTDNYYLIFYSFAISSIILAILFSYFSYKIFEEKVPRYIKKTFSL